MSEPNLNELNESIKLLSSYHDRLQKEVINIAQKLQMPQAKITRSLDKNTELKDTKQAIINLIDQRNKQLNQAHK